MLVLMRKFLRPLVFMLMIIFVTFGVTGCASTINTIRTISQAKKVQKIFKSAIAVGDVIDLKRNVSDLADKILKHR